MVLQRVAAESKPQAYALGYVEDVDETRAKLKTIVSILLFERDARRQRAAPPQ